MTFKANLDIFWLKEESLEDTENLPSPDILATEIAENLESALEQFNNIIDELSSQTKMPFYILTSNPQIIRGGMKNWKVTRFGHASKGRGDTRINNELRSSLSRKRITVSMQYKKIIKKGGI